MQKLHVLPCTFCDALLTGMQLAQYAMIGCRMKHLRICFIASFAVAVLLTETIASAKIQEAVTKGQHFKKAKVEMFRNKGTGKVNTHDITVKKNLDKSSPMLQENTSGGPLKGGLLDNETGGLSTQGPSATGAPGVPAGAAGVRSR
ncbi:MAG: hypothetical protein ACXWJW_00930 [Xanthobacteraceae bacterium]